MQVRSRERARRPLDTSQAAWGESEVTAASLPPPRPPRAGREIVGVRLTQAAYAHGLALALPQKVELARPTGLEPATFGSGTQRSIH
jgi:hypothetical protein